MGGFFEEDDDDETQRVGLGQSEQTLNAAAATAQRCCRNNLKPVERIRGGGLSR